jgi:hypothetical protein
MGIISSLNNLLSEPANEGFLFTTSDLRLNIDNWGKSKRDNVLFITGISGSGKSYLSNDIAKDNKSVIVWSLDDFQAGKVQKNEVIEGLLKVVPAYNDILNHNIAENDSSNKVTPIMNKVVAFLIKYASNMWPNYKYIMEGMQLYRYIKPEFVYEKPLIVKNTSVASSAINGIKRVIANHPDKSYSLKNIYNMLLNWLYWGSHEYKYLKKYEGDQKINK